MEHAVHTNRPEDFESKLDVVCCLVMHNRKILMCRRAEGRRQGGKWGFPGGKIEPNEKVYEACRRELTEETGIDTTKIGIHESGTYYIHYKDGNGDFTIITCIISLDYEPNITLDKREHSELQVEVIGIPANVPTSVFLSNNSRG